MKQQFDKLLNGGDLRSIGKVDLVISKVYDQNDFDQVFQCLFHTDRLIVMRAADAIEKITVRRPSYLLKHKKEILKLCTVAGNKELRWHLALLIPRLNLTADEIDETWQLLTDWALNDESKIVRVNSIQALYQIACNNKRLMKTFETILSAVKKENIPSINARIRKLTSLTQLNH